MKRRKKHLIQLRQIILIRFSLITKVLLDSQVLLRVVLESSSTFLESLKATVLRVALLHTHKDSNDLEVSTESPLT